MSKFDEERLRIIEQGAGYGCVGRAKRLVEALGKLAGTEDAHILEAWHAQPATREDRYKYKSLFPRASDASGLEWKMHAICVAAGMVYDPILPEPVAIEEYGQLMFGDQPVDYRQPEEDD